MLRHLGTAFLFENTRVAETRGGENDPKLVTWAKCRVGLGVGVVERVINQIFLVINFRHFFYVGSLGYGLGHSYA